MRDPERIKRICSLLKDVWMVYPDQRLGQFLLNYVFGSQAKNMTIFYMEDDDIEKNLEAFKQHKIKNKELKNDDI